MLFFVIFMMKRSKPRFAVIYNLYISLFRSDLSEHTVLGEHVGVNPPSSCAFLTWVGLVWMLVPLCSRRSQLQYWQKYSWLLMKLPGSL